MATEKIPFVDLAGENAPIFDEVLMEVGSVIKSGKYILGKKVYELEALIKKYCGVSNFLTLNSGADALMLSLIAMDLPRGSKVIVPANSFIASAWAVNNANLKIQFCDVGNDMLANFEIFNKMTDELTAAWMPVHLSGSLCDMNSIMQNKSPQIRVIEDAAQAFGSGDGLIHGDIACYSLNPLKVLGAMGDGGFLLTNNDQLAKKVFLLRNHGLEVRDDATCWGYNSRLDEIQAAIILVKMKYFNDTLGKLRALAKRYIDNLNADIKIPSKNFLNSSTWHRFVVYAENRNDLKNYLASNNVDTAINYEVPLHLQPIGRSLGYCQGDFPNVEWQAQHKLSLPLYPHLSESNQDHVIECINRYFR